MSPEITFRRAWLTYWYTDVPKNGIQRLLALHQQLATLANPEVSITAKCSTTLLSKSTSNIWYPRVWKSSGWSSSVRHREGRCREQGSHTRHTSGALVGVTRVPGLSGSLGHPGIVPAPPPVGWGSSCGTSA